jgi:hypothetical protein
VAEIVLKRPGGYKSDRLRAYQVYIDGQKMGQIKPDETQAFDVPPGHHELRLKIDWGASETLPVRLGEDDVAKFVCGPRVKETDDTLLDGYRVAYWMTFGCKRYIDLQQGERLPVETASKTRWQTLGGPTLFGVALLVGIAFWALTGNDVVVVGVVVAAMALVVGGLVGRGIGKVAGQTTEEVRKRRGRADRFREQK